MADGNFPGDFYSPFCFQLLLSSLVFGESSWVEGDSGLAIGESRWVIGEPSWVVRDSKLETRWKVERRSSTSATVAQNVA